VAGVKRKAVLLVIASDEDRGEVGLSFEWVDSVRLFRLWWRSSLILLMVGFQMATLNQSIKKENITTGRLAIYGNAVVYAF
jgi:hypothetical protein